MFPKSVPPYQMKWCGGGSGGVGCDGGSCGGSVGGGCGGVGCGGGWSGWLDRGKCPN